MRPAALVAVLGLLLVAVAAGALAAPPRAAGFQLDGVDYVYITGVNRTGTVTLNGGAPMPIESCAFVMLHPGTPNGRVRLTGIQGGTTPIDLIVDQFRLDDGKRGYSYDKQVSEDGLGTLADVALQGNASLRVNGGSYYDPVGSTGDPLLDKEAPQMRGAVVDLSQGVRDDLDGSVLPQAARDRELHVHLRSNPQASPKPETFTFDNGGSAPLLPNEAYGAAYPLQNHKIGGKATLTLSSTAYAMAGENRLHVRVLSPMGDTVAEMTLEPALLQDDGATAEFPLDRFGTYTVLVDGQVSLATYQGRLEMAPPDALDLHFWYENVTYGHQAYQDYKACLAAVAGPNEVLGVESVVGQPAPPRFDPWLAVIAVAGVVGGGAVAVKLAADQVAASSFRKGK